MIELPAEESPPFAQLLPLAREAGAYHLPAAHAQALIDAAEGLEFACHLVDLGECRDKPAVLRAFAAALSFPDWFGDNWDALSDALSDLGWLDERAGRVLVLERCATLRAAAQDDYDMLVGILDEAAEGWREIALPFWSFLCEEAVR
jgi:RNAse (barnase) inhibitor barstar